LEFWGRGYSGKKKRKMFFDKCGTLEAHEGREKKKKPV